MEVNGICADSVEFSEREWDPSSISSGGVETWLLTAQQWLHGGGDGDNDRRGQHVHDLPSPSCMGPWVEQRQVR